MEINLISFSLVKTYTTVHGQIVTGNSRPHSMSVSMSNTCWELPSASTRGSHAQDVTYVCNVVEAHDYGFRSTAVSGEHSRSKTSAIIEMYDVLTRRLYLTRTLLVETSYITIIALVLLRECLPLTTVELTYVRTLLPNTGRHIHYSPTQGVTYTTPQHRTSHTLLPNTGRHIHYSPTQDVTYTTPQHRTSHTLLPNTGRHIQYPSPPQSLTPPSPSPPQSLTPPVPHPSSPSPPQSLTPPVPHPPSPSPHQSLTPPVPHPSSPSPPQSLTPPVPHPSSPSPFCHPWHTVCSC